MRDDKCEVKTLSCFEWKDLFDSLKYSNLQGDFSAYFSYVLLEFNFILTSTVTPSISRSSVIGMAMLSQWTWTLTWVFPITIAWYFEVFFFSYRFTHTIDRHGQDLH